MKKVEWRNPNKMIFESEHKTFNRQADLISTGNVWGGVQTSGFVRPYNQTECNGFTNPPGKLRDFDLSLWRNMPSHVRAYVIKQTRDRSVILYEFHHKTRIRWGGVRWVTHGWVVTTVDYKLLRSFVTGPTYKSYSVIREAIKYIVECEHPPSRLYSWTAFDKTRCVGCCECGAILAGDTWDYSQKEEERV